MLGYNSHVSRREALATTSLAVASSVGLAGCAALAPDQEQSYPDETIEMMIPMAEGGQTDLETRLIVEYLQEELDESIATTNEPAAGGGVSYQQLSTAESDGYTLSSFMYPLVQTHASVMEDFDYDPDAFTLLGQFSSVPLNIMTGYDSDLETFADLLERGEDEPLTIAFTGPVAPAAIPILQLQEELDIELDPVFTGGGQALANEAQAGRVDAAANTLDTTANNMAAERTRPLAIFAEPEEDLLEFYQDSLGVTLEEGMFITEYDDLIDDPPLMSTFKGLIGPPDLPDDVESTIEDALLDAMARDEWAEQMADMGSRPMPAESSELETAWNEHKSEFEPHLPLLSEFAERHQ
jgi:tripartite-type tricarboxylate transporter receptor subunit TctC